jgi:pimeloyl-ACP methyl ester carboxylesterase
LSDLLLLHGALGASAQFTPLIDRLGATFRVHTLDFEGHGSTPPRDRPFRIRHFAEDVLEYLDAHAIKRAGIFGYSMGGYVALVLAAGHPERATRVVTLGTKFRWDPDTAARDAARLDPAVIRARVPRFADALAARHERAGGWERVVAATAECLRDLGENPVLTDEVLAGIAIPVRVMVGDRDNTVSVEESAGAARVLPQGELAVLPRTPHPIEQVDPARLAGLLDDFFAAPPARP